MEIYVYQAPIDRPRPPSPDDKTFPELMSALDGFSLQMALNRGDTIPAHYKAKGVAIWYLWGGGGRRLPAKQTFFRHSKNNQIIQYFFFIKYLSETNIFLSKVFFSDNPEKQTFFFKNHHIKHDFL